MQTITMKAGNLWFAGLSGSEKSTLARAVVEKCPGLADMLKQFSIL